jgi:hypothetical protein
MNLSSGVREAVAPFAQMEEVFVESDPEEEDEADIEHSILLHGLVHIAEQCDRWGPMWSMSSDGFPVFDQNDYSVEPMVAVILNLPPWLRVLAINMIPPE